nr:MarR family transcriptional regulator [Bacilliculturomica massiliensis]
MELNQCINYLLTTSQHRVSQAMSARLSEFDITPVQYGVLYCLWVEKKKSPKEIAEILHLETSTISGILERMEKKGMLRRSISREDRRFIEIELTEKALALQEPVLDAVEEVNATVLADMSKEKQELFKSLLREIAEISLPARLMDGKTRRNEIQRKN